MDNFNFWDSEVWGVINIFAVLLVSLLLANSLKKAIPVLKQSLIPSSVLGGFLLLLFSVIYEKISGKIFFNTEFFGGNGCGILEILTYHGLALGFIATSLKPTSTKFDKHRSMEIFDTGVTTVAVYLMQGILGLSISLLFAALNNKLFPSAGIILPFAFGQGTGQALNYGSIYEQDFGFTGGRSFGLTMAAIGFLSAAIGGITRLHILKKQGKKYKDTKDDYGDVLTLQDIQGPGETPMNGSIDKLTEQLVFIGLAYLLAYGIIYALGNLVGSLKSILYGFNFLIGVLTAVLVKGINRLLMEKGIVRRQHISSFMMTRLSGFFFDIMIVAGVAAIRLDVLKGYWPEILVLSITGAVLTFLYTLFVSKKLFPSYAEEQFMVTYGMLTGTASTGVILLKEIDSDFSTPASENLVYQTLPAMVFGFPMMLLAAVAPVRPMFVLGMMIPFFIVMNIILFRRSIFIKKKKN